VTADVFGRTGRPDARVEPALSMIRRAWLYWRFRVLRRNHHRRLVLERVDGMRLIVLPDVFNPTLFGSSRMLIEALDRYELGSGSAVLDMGTGSGIGAVAAALRGAAVVAIDIAPEAVRCVRINALLNQVDGAIDVRQGDLFEPLRGERFDFALFNPPFYAGEPRDGWDMAWRSTGTLDRFAADLPGVLKANGKALIVVSSRMADVSDVVRRRSVSSRLILERRLADEWLMVFEWMLPGLETATEYQ
jgi:release factor glutamine methyltransferase